MMIFDSYERSKRERSKRWAEAAGAAEPPRRGAPVNLIDNEIISENNPIKENFLYDISHRISRGN